MPGVDVVCKEDVIEPVVVVNEDERDDDILGGLGAWGDQSLTGGAGSPTVLLCTRKPSSQGGEGGHVPRGTAIERHHRRQR